VLRPAAPSAADAVQQAGQAVGDLLGGGRTSGP
jgi:hypothetical protein